MSLVGSSVKLETGKQIDTKTRQKPLDNNKNSCIFVSFPNDKCIRVNVLGISNQVNKILTGSVYIGMYNQPKLVLMLQTMGDGSPKKVSRDNSRGYVWHNIKKWHGLYFIEMDPKKSVYEIPADTIKALFCESNWGSRKIKRWSQCYNGTTKIKRPLQCGKKKPYLKFRIVLALALPTYEKMSSEKSVNNNQAVDGFYYKILKVTKKKYLTL